jgi:hypothetical protein
MFFQPIEEGIVVFLINAIISSVLFLALRPYVRERLESWVSGFLSEYFEEQLKVAIENPEKVSKLFAPIVKALIAEALKDFERQSGGKPQTLNLFGFKIPAEIANILIQKLLGGSNEKNINPFS